MQIYSQEAVLHITNGDVVKDYCIVHNHSWTPLAQTLQEAVSFYFAVFYSIVSSSCKLSECGPLGFINPCLYFSSYSIPW